MSEMKGSNQSGSNRKERDILVEMRGISKSFGAVQALQNVNLRLYHDEILGIVGDNAAGKSTLMKLLSGVHIPDAGNIYLNGEKVRTTPPQKARNLGIEMVYQDLALCGKLDVATNIFLGRWPTRRGMINFKRMHTIAEEMLQGLGVEIQSVNLPVETLSGGRQQSVAIARAISSGPKVLIMDEPTANLSAAAIGQVLHQIQNLKEHGVSVIIISHRLEDIFDVGDRIMVLKRGHNVGERIVRKTNHNEILKLIITGYEK